MAEARPLFICGSASWYCWPQYKHGHVFVHVHILKATAPMATELKSALLQPCDSKLTERVKSLRQPPFRGRDEKYKIRWLLGVRCSAYYRKWFMSWWYFFCPKFVISGMSETRAWRGGRVFTRSEAAECDAGQAYPPESKTNIGQVAEALSLWLCRFKWMVVGCVGCSSHITLSAKAFIFSWTLNPSCGNRSGNQVKSRHLFFFSLPPLWVKC